MKKCIARIVQASHGKSSAAEVEELRKAFALQAAKARKMRRDVMITLERRRKGAALQAETTAQHEATLSATQEVATATKMCQSLRAGMMKSCKDVDSKLEVSEEEFLQKQPAPDAEETECARLKRRVKYEIDLKSELGEEKVRLTKEILQNKSKMRSLKKFFQSSVSPLEELTTKVRMVHDSIGGAQDAIGGITSSYLPVALYKVQRCLMAALGDMSVTVGGNTVDAQAFINSKKHLKGGAATELFPLRLTARLMETKDEPPSLCFYFRPSTQEVVAEAVCFEHTILVNASSDCKEHSGMFYAGSLVMGVTAPWITDAANAELRNGEYDCALQSQISLLLKEIEYRQDLSTILSILKSGRNSLGLTNIVPIVQKYLPSYPSPRVSVIDVKMGSSNDDERKDKKSRTDDDESKQFQFKIELDHITYKIVGSVGAGYPNRTPHFKLQIREKLRDTEFGPKAGFRIPDALLLMASPVCSLNSCRPACGSVQFRLAEEEKDSKSPPKSGSKDKDKETKAERKKRKRDEAVQQTADYTTAVIDGGFVDVVAEHFSKVINRDCVLETPLVKKGHVLMRQILMSVFFVEAFHPYLLRKGVAGIYTETDRHVTDASAALHDPSDFRLLHHNTTPLHRGREVQLPIHWDTNILRWTYKTPTDSIPADMMLLDY
eukprot:TRINITY_DN21247_c0_g1_i2.p1 TRINITY_DN21247_c0_g1~~TRINITY_DN21247_c0_g1_i2.p1  ORF type:complete len:716 (+),score=272.76 TRINITY_DN21247_c0_g1_i2:158-2149(+)